jgi:iron(III) transport system substrate-binding protein
VKGWKGIAVVSAAIAFAIGGIRQFSVAQEGRAKLVDLARREGKVVAYGTITLDAFRVIQRIFESRYGMPVEYWRAAATQVYDRVLAEHRAGRVMFDVVTANRGPMLLLKAQGVFQPYVSPSYEDYPVTSKDREGILSPAYRMTVVGILYNTRLVSPSEAPRTLLDLVDRRWRRQIVMPDPNLHTTTLTWLVNLKRVLGGQWRGYVEGLAAQVGALVESFLPAAERVIRGEFPIGISYVHYTYLFREAPLEYVRTGPLLADAHVIGLAKHAPHPSAGKLLVDLMTSRAAAHVWAQSGEFPMFPGIYPPVKDAEKLKILLMEDLSERAFIEAKRELGQLFVVRQ